MYLLYVRPGAVDNLNAGAAAADGPTVYFTSCMLGLVLFVILMMLQLLLILEYTVPPVC